jgi:hypothetical protein
VLQKSSPFLLGFGSIQQCQNDRQANKETSFFRGEGRRDRSRLSLSLSLSLSLMSDQQNLWSTNYTFYPKNCLPIFTFGVTRPHSFIHSFASGGQGRRMSALPLSTGLSFPTLDRAWLTAKKKFFATTQALSLALCCLSYPTLCCLCMRLPPHAGGCQGSGQRPPLFLKKWPCQIPDTRCGFQPDQVVFEAVAKSGGFVLHQTHGCQAHCRMALLLLLLAVVSAQAVLPISLFFGISLGLIAAWQSLVLCGCECVVDLCFVWPFSTLSPIRPPTTRLCL